MRLKPCPPRQEILCFWNLAFIEFRMPPQVRRNKCCGAPGPFLLFSVARPLAFGIMSSAAGNHWCFDTLHSSSGTRLFNSFETSTSAHICSYHLTRALYPWNVSSLGEIDCVLGTLHLWSFACLLKSFPTNVWWHLFSCRLSRGLWRLTPCVLRPAF